MRAETVAPTSKSNPTRHTRLGVARNRLGGQANFPGVLTPSRSNPTGMSNTADGGDALVLNTTGSGNTAIGTGALSSNTTGNGNTAVGSAAGHDLTSGDQNIVLAIPMLLANPTLYASATAYYRHAPLSLAFVGWQPEITMR